MSRFLVVKYRDKSISRKIQIQKYFFTLIETQKKCGIHTASVEVEAFQKCDLDKANKCKELYT